MNRAILQAALAALITLSFGMAAEADIIMDATTHNGALAGGDTGNWTSAASVPANWGSDTSNWCYTAASFVQIYSPGNAWNNTGEPVTPGYAYTIQADLGCQVAGVTANGYVYATENADGTGAKVELAHVSRYSATGDGNVVYTTSVNTGAVAHTGLAGYYLQVLLTTDPTDAYGNGNYDNIVVTGADAPGSPPPPPHVVMNADKHNGDLETSSVGGYWSAGVEYIPAGWTSSVPSRCYTTTIGFIYINSSDGPVAYNNTGEQVLPRYAYAIQADLGCNTADATANAYVYATENADGTGAKVELAHVSRYSATAEGWNLFPSPMTTGIVAQASLASYYLQVLLASTGGGADISLFDNIVVEGEYVPPKGTVVLVK